MPQVLSLWIDHPKIGCGERHFLVLKSSTKKTKLLAVGTMQVITISTAELRGMRHLKVPLHVTRMLRRLRQNGQTFERSKSLMREAIRAVKHPVEIASGASKR